MSEEQQNTYQGQPLTDNLGTARSIRQMGEIDMRKFTNIENEDVLFLIYCKLRGKKSSTWQVIEDEFLNLKVGVNAMGSRYAIRGEQVRKGIPSNVGEEIPSRPNVLARHLWDREGEEKYQQYKKENEIE